MLKHEEGYCKYCSHNEVDECHHAVMKDYCPTNLTVDSLVTAAEFETRVAAQLAAWETLPVPCMNDIFCNRSSLECASCRLKWARLTVEEEMDGYNTM